VSFSKEVKAGFIAILAITSFVILFQFMKGRRVFSRDNTYYVTYDNVEGVDVSRPVYLNGMKIGQVESIIPINHPDGQMSFIVELSIGKKFSFSKSSTVEVFESGLMSNPSLKIIQDYSQPFAKNGDTLKGVLKPSMIGQLLNDIQPIKEKLSSLLSKLDFTVASTNEILNADNDNSINSLLKNLNKTVSLTNNILSNNNKKINNILSNANAAIINYGKIAESVDTKQLKETLEKLNHISNNLNEILSGIESGNGSLGKLVKDENLYNNLNNSAISINKLMDDLKANPKRYVHFSIFGKSSK